MPGQPSFPSPEFEPRPFSRKSPGERFDWSRFPERPEEIDGQEPQEIPEVPEGPDRERFDLSSTRIRPEDLPGAGGDFTLYNFPAPIPDRFSVVTPNGYRIEQAAAEAAIQRNAEQTPNAELAMGQAPNVEEATGPAPNAEVAIGQAPAPNAEAPVSPESLRY